MKLTSILGGEKFGQSYTGLRDYKERTDLTMAVNTSILMSYIMNAYRFHNVPDELDQNLMWAILGQYSKAVMFYNDDVGEFMFLPYHEEPNNQNNYLFLPPLVKAYDFINNEYRVVTTGRKTIGEEVYEGRIVHVSNTSRFNFDIHHMLMFYASKMTEIDRSIDVRRNYHRAPGIFTGNSSMKSSFVKLFQEITEFKPFFVTSENMMEGFNMTNMDFNYMSDSLYNEKVQYQNEFLNLWGINNNTNEDKKERLNVDEVNINNEQILINRDNVLNSLNSFCDEMNDLFGLEMYASFNNRVIKSDTETVIDELFDWGEDDEINL